MKRCKDYTSTEAFEGDDPSVVALKSLANIYGQIFDDHATAIEALQKETEELKARLERVERKAFDLPHNVSISDLTSN